MVCTLFGTDHFFLYLVSITKHVKLNKMNNWIGDLIDNEIEAQEKKCNDILKKMLSDSGYVSNNLKANLTEYQEKKYSLLKLETGRFLDNRIIVLKVENEKASELVEFIEFINKMKN